MPRLDLPLEPGLGLWEAQTWAEERWNSLCGCDEAGRGPLAGPVVCAAVQLPVGFKLPGLRDSKKLSAKSRGEFYRVIQSQVEIKSIVQVSPAEIDRLNILGASLWGMAMAARNLNLAQVVPVVDGSQLLRDWSGEQYTLVKGDDRLACIAAASILAKEFRDQLMLQAHEIYPGYGFAQHKGYPTVEHLAALRQLGPCPLHRHSFGPVAAAQMELFG